MKTEFEIMYSGQILCVSGYFNDELPASPDGLTPPFPATFEIDEIIWRKQLKQSRNYIDVDVTDLIGCFPDKMSDIENKCLIQQISE